MQHVAAWLATVIRRTFEKKTSPEGEAWVPLSEKYAARKKGPGILRETSALYEQVTRGALISGNTITAGSTLPYAAAHQFGLEGDVSVRTFLRRARGKQMWAQVLGKNNKIVRGRLVGHEVSFPRTPAHSRHMNIPARPYLPTPAFVESEGAKVAQEFVRSELAAEINGS